MANNTKNNLKENIKGNINAKKEDAKAGENIKTNNEVTNNQPAFKIAKKQDEKTGKKAFNVYVHPDTLKNLDKLSKQTKKSRNEVVNEMIEFCLNSFEITEE
ncbi:CopG family transcriptional regulator [Clostridium ganghwense]|uniref:CopG family transcriptional regulator n=1 Tax=Clostridium ganghwense TaxID=312089 RepID=A0ABT4CUM6_9CLOT|nr:CopG family transcriptional regulator [Clostridium ganghwense]MCY6372767.1 CopG family transcriptional regulator [Clostridium ganghwense]